MPEEKNDGGHVYPRAKTYNQPAGITRRDWLAGLAMQGLLSDSEAMQKSFNNNHGDDEKVIADTSMLAYKIADTMIAESNK